MKPRPRLLFHHRISLFSMLSPYFLTKLKNHSSSGRAILFLLHDNFATTKYRKLLPFFTDFDRILYFFDLKISFSASFNIILTRVKSGLKNNYQIIHYIHSITLLFVFQGKEKRLLYSTVFSLFRQRPTLPGSHPPSTISAEELNFCVRNGNRWDLFAIVTGFL